MANIPTYPRLHCYFGCEEGGPLHRFPKPHNNSERFAVWKAVLCKETREKGDMYIYNTFKLCNKHFENYYVLESKQLTRNSVPTLYLEFERQVNSQLLKPTAEVVNYTSPQPEPSTSSTSSCNFVQTTKLSQKKKSVQGFTNQKDNLRIIEMLKKKIIKLTQKSKNVKKKILAGKKISEKKSFLKAIDSMPDSIQTFIKMQMKCKIKPKGRKFTLDEKIMAASIWKQSQKGYNYLSKCIVLPSKRTLQRLNILHS